VFTCINGTIIVKTLLLCLGMRETDLKRLVGFDPKGEIMCIMVGTCVELR